MAAGRHLTFLRAIAAALLWGLLETAALLRARYLHRLACRDHD